MDGKLAPVKSGKRESSQLFSQVQLWAVTFHGMLAEKVKASLKPDGKEAFSIDAEGHPREKHLSVTGKLAFTRAGTGDFPSQQQKDRYRRDCCRAFEPGGRELHGQGRF